MKLSKKYTIVFLAIYGMIALFIRLYVEPAFGVSYIQSISIGLATLVPLWLLFKLNFLTLTGGQES
jgi:hypothetical protein